MKHTIAILLQNESGALTRVASMFSTRGYNIDSLSVAPTDNPSISRLRNYTYSLSIYIDLIIIISINDNNSIVILPNRTIKNVLLGKIPIMVKSKYCTYKNDNQMCPFDLGGYLIINGNEKVIISQEKICPNKIFIFDCPIYLLLTVSYFIVVRHFI